ncbi:protein-L-isoaspartate(D-aspartate) O-methyltransferase [Trichloromonas sp.]|uniref:protein-L-isoaspartate(D-aspartate) O-methyltransferase n=1 Tax=Trichloromonas sp. TaxID=3069249 RepID=UPI003D813A08
MRPDRIEQMLRTIEQECHFTGNATGRSSLRPVVMEAMASVPRDDFVPSELKHRAFDNGALPIGEGQTISQPFIVALMTDLLEPQPDHTILEIGTGCGYQAAVLSCLVKQVISIEIIPHLANLAAERLQRLGYRNVQVMSGDGYQGLPEQAPFDGIIVTAAASHVPAPLFKQLKPGGNLVIPVGLPYMHQELLVVSKDRSGQRHTRSALPVIFVPLTRNRETGGEPADNTI